MSKLNYSNTNEILPKLQSAEITVGKAIELLNDVLEQEKQEEIRISEIDRISLKPDDVLMVTIKNDHLDESSLQGLSRSLKSIFPNNKVSVFGVGSEDQVKFHVASFEKPAVVQSYCSDCNCGKKEKMEAKNE